MRIAILTNAIPPDGKGGAERIAYLQAEGLAKRGHDVRAWAPWGSGSWVTGSASNGTNHRPQTTNRISHDPGPLIHDAFPVERFRSRFSLLSRMTPLRRLFFHLIDDIGPDASLVNDILSWKPDVLISHNLTGCGMKTPVILKQRGIPWIHILHDIQLTEPSGQLRADRDGSVSGRLWRWFWAWYRRRAWLRQPDVLVSPTSWLLEWHKHYGFRGMSERVLPNPVHVGPERERHVHMPATLAYVGRLSEDKGFTAYLDLASVFQQAAVGRFLVVGDGPLRGAPDVLGDARFDLRGALSPEEARKIIGQADVLIAPSRILENQQTILLEAMAEGTPVVATDVGGTRETLAGTSCRAVQEQELSAEVLRLIGHPDAWSTASMSMRRGALRHASDRYLDSLVELVAGLSRS